MKAKQLKRRQERQRRAEWKTVWRRLTARKGAKVRVCGSCTACPREQPCGWREGLLADDHRPDTLGVLVEARILPREDGTEIVCAVVREVSPGALELETVGEIVQALSVAVPVLVARMNGDVVKSVGIPGSSDALA